VTTLRDLGIVGFLVLACAAAYWPVGRYEFVNFDDDVYVSDNWQVQQGLTAEGARWAFTTFHEANWHPLTWLSHMLDCQLFGLWAGGHHLVNVALHAANSVLIFLVLRRMTARQWPSAFVAALFALHPLHVESVAWVAERKDVLSTFFGLLALLAYAWYAERPSVWRYAAVFIFLALGLMAKPMLVTLPFVMLLLDWWPLGRLTGNAGEECGVRNAGLTAKARRFGFSLRTPHSALRVGLEKLPLLVLAASSSVVTYVAQSHGGAMAGVEACPLPLRFANALVAYVAYLGKTFWPSGLSAFYPYVSERPLWQPVAAGAFLVAVTALALLAARRRTAPLPDGRGSDTARRRPYLAVGWFWYLGTLVPVIGLVQVGEQSMADRYTYVPLVGVFIMAAWGAADLARGWRHGRKAAALASVAAVAVCLTLTWRQVGYWADSEVLFRHMLRVTPENALAANNLGVALGDCGQLEDSASWLREALRMRPHYPDAHDNLGAVLARMDRLDEALGHMREAVRLRPDRPRALSNLGGGLYRLGRNQEAVEVLRRALRLNPWQPAAHTNLAAALIVLGMPQEAVEHCREAVRLKPEWADPQYNWGLALMVQERWTEAADHLHEAIRLRPGFFEALTSLAVCWVHRGGAAQAVVYLREALRHKPDFVPALDQLAQIRATDPDPALRNGAEAVALAERACALTARRQPGCLATLAAAYAEAGRFAEAVAAAREASALASAVGRGDLAARVDAHRQAYEAGRPVRQGTESVVSPATPALRGGSADP